jgi:hypothetical protein
MKAPRPRPGRPRGGVRWIAATLLAAAVALAAPPADERATAWHDLAASQAAAALVRFRTLESAEPARADEARIGQATALLLVQPRTASNLNAARALARRVAEEGEIAWIPAGRYLLARIAEFHTSPADYPEARRQYRILSDIHGATELGQIALTKLAILDMREPAPADERERRYTGLVALEVRLTDPAARRDFHLALADGCLREGLGEERALRHSLLAEAAGIVHPGRRASVILRIAELSRRLGRPEEARRHYRRFLDLVGDRDNRALLVRERLNTLGVEATP